MDGVVFSNLKQQTSTHKLYRKHHNRKKWNKNSHEEIKNEGMGRDTKLKIIYARLNQ